jgi:2-polyprenyl-3-methyl-5-hydroxy-6-metoxy-1,4-benzoquinol methylase
MITVAIDRLRVGSGDRVLDVGCGSGRHMGAMVRLANVAVYGADIRIGEVREACRRLRFIQRCGESRSPWAVTASSVLALPFDDATFDAVICSEVLEHIADHEAAAGELVRILKPGKILAVSVPRYLPERVCWALSPAYRRAPNGHVRIYRDTELTALFATRGMRVMHRHFAHSLHTPYWWLKCCIGCERDDHKAVALVHRLLVWDMMQRPWLTRTLDRMLNPVIGKSRVVYLVKDAP